MATTQTKPLTLQNLLAFPNVASDPKLVAWVNGNSSLIPKLAGLGYSIEDLANEAYSWTRNNRSAFSGDMTTTQRSANKANTANAPAAAAPTGGTPSGTASGTPTGAATATAPMTAVNGVYWTYMAGGKVYDAATGKPIDMNEYNSKNGKVPINTVEPPAQVGTPSPNVPKAGGQTQTNAGTSTQGATGNSGTTSPSGGTTAQAGPADFKAQRQRLLDIGLDPTQVGLLSDEQVGAMYSMRLYMEMNADKNKNIVPPTNSGADMEQFLRDAHTVIDPYYAEQLKVGSTEILNAVADLSGDVAYKSQLQAQQSQKDQEELAGKMAEQGLAYSGIRNKAETQMKNNEQGLVRSIASQYQGKLRDSALQYEKQYGSEALRALNIKDLNYAGANIPAPLPLGGMMGTDPKQQAVDVFAKRDKLAEESLKKKGAMSGAITPFPVTPSTY